MGKLNFSQNTISYTKIKDNARSGIIQANYQR